MKFTNSPYLYLSIALALCMLALGFLPQVNDSAVSLDPQPAANPIVNSTPAVEANDNDIHKAVDQMPLWPGCDDKGAYLDRKACADQLMLEFIYDRVRYPEKAKDANTEGMAVISFVVEKDGRVTGEKIERNPGSGTGEEALRVVRLMQSEEIYWTAGRLDGKPVRVKFNLPVKFKLE
ncbi:energy transducer TonB [Neolewinella antarctica]|uniref:TonB family protein n=1 Tax=Neolewinella antarctica TaxID=442734 RepID=A0ABX0XGI3_9BACT|nr:energy transducer TonB [Neolewinella antarctica]NJC27888.1 TonB family protein [Neolewinella antarctica]